MRGAFRGICLLSVMMLGACATAGQKFELPNPSVGSEQSRVIFYHTGNDIFNRAPANLYLDDKPVCLSREGEAAAFDVAPGEHSLKIHTKLTSGTSVLFFTTEAGKTTYVSGGTNTNRAVVGALFGVLGTLAVSDRSTPGGGHVFLELSSKEAADKEMGKMERSSCPPDFKAPPAPPTPSPSSPSTAAR